MNQKSIVPRRLVWAACALLLHLCTATSSTGQPLTIIAGPITNPANAHIYYLLAPTNWIGAWFNAQRAGGRLVTINDAAENAWVFDTFANYDGVPRNLWLGLRDSAQEGTWVWDSGDPSIYRNWAPGEPDNGGGGNEDYAAMRGPVLSSPGTWSDVSGDVTNAPVVEKIPLTNPPPVNVAPSIISQPQNWTVPIGADVSFFVSATGTTPLSYQWRHFEMNLTGATNAWLTLSNVHPADAGTYSVLVSNIVGVAISSNAILTIFTPGTNCVARPAGLVAWWRAEGNANDSAGTNHGITGWPKPIEAVFPADAAGEVGRAFNCGGYSVVIVPGSLYSSLTNSFAVEGWIHARQSTGVIFGLGPTANLMRLGMEPSTGNMAFGIGNAVSLLSPIQLNQWHHIAATFEDTSGAMILYVDGVARAQTNTVIRSLANVGEFWLPIISIGSAVDGCRFNTCLSLQFNGLIDELSVYSRALTSNEVHAIYSAGSGGKCAVSGAALGVASLVCEPGASTTLRIGGMAGNTYLIQASTNLLDWQVVGSSVADTNGVCEFEDLDSASFRGRYYRVIAPTSWITNSASITDDGMTLPATNSAQFFRLRRPWFCVASEPREHAQNDEAKNENQFQFSCTADLCLGTDTRSGPPASRRGVQRCQLDEHGRDSWRERPGLRGGGG